MAFFAAIVTTVAWQVFARQLGIVSVWTEELSRWLFVYLSFIGFSLVSMDNTHIRIDVFLAVPFLEKFNRYTEWVVSFLTLYFCLVLLQSGFTLIDHFGNDPSASMDMRVKILYYSVPISFILATIFEAMRLIRQGAALYQAMVHVLRKDHSPQQER